MQLIAAEAAALAWQRYPSVPVETRTVAGYAVASILGGLTDIFHK